MVLGYRPTNTPRRSRCCLSTKEIAADVCKPGEEERDARRGGGAASGRREPVFTWPQNIDRQTQSWSCAEGGYAAVGQDDV